MEQMKPSKCSHHRGPSLFRPARLCLSPAGRRLSVLSGASRCRQMRSHYAAYLKVSGGLLARHKIDLHQGHTIKATQAKQACHFEMQRVGHTCVSTAFVALNQEIITTDTITEGLASVLWRGKNPPPGARLRWSTSHQAISIT